MSLEMYEKLKLKNLDSTSIPHVVGASGESLDAIGKTKCEININGKIFYQTFIVCEHLKRPIILGRDFSIQNCIGISWTKTNTCRLTQNNEVIAETAEYQTPSRASVSLKKNIKVPPRSCAVVDVDINTAEKIKVEVTPDQLWLSANPNICTYPMIADLKEREQKKHSNTIRYCELQSSQTLTSPQRPCSGLHRERLQGRRSVRNLHHGTTGKRTTQKLDTRKKMAGKVQ